jgi:hypothetical protein
MASRYAVRDGLTVVKPQDSEVLILPLQKWIPRKCNQRFWGQLEGSWEVVVGLLATSSVSESGHKMKILSNCGRK